MKFTLLLAAILLITVPAAAENSVTVGNTIISSANVGPKVPTLGTAIDSKKTIECTSTKGCVLLLQAMAEIESKGTSPTSWEICVVVDKSFSISNPNCPVQGELPAKGTPPGGVVTGTVLQSAIVKKGKHTVQTGVLAGVKAKVGSWQTTYTILKE